MKAAWETTGNAAVDAMVATSAAAKGAAPNVKDVADQAKAMEKAMAAAGKALDKYFEAEEKPPRHTLYAVYTRFVF